MLTQNPPERVEAFRQVLEELFKQYPVPGNPEHRRRRYGIHKTETYRRELLGEAGWVYASSTYFRTGGLLNKQRRHTPLGRMCLRAKIPFDPVFAAHAILFS